MKALSCIQPGVLKYMDVDDLADHDDCAILQVKRVGICGTDLHAYDGTQPYFEYPRILGHELSAEIISVRSGLGFNVGEAVTILPYFNCNNCIACRNGKPNCCVNLKVFGVHIDGGMREYIAVPVNKLIKNGGLSYDQLALVEPLAIGAHAIKRANIQEQEFVLVIGTGPIGLGIIEFAKVAGAKVIALDVNQHRLNFCRDNLGINMTINAATENVAEQLKSFTSDDMATVVIDATGNLDAINKGIHFLAHGGRYILVGLQKESFKFSHPEFHKREATLMSSRNALIGDFEHVINSIKKGAINTSSYITHRATFNEVKDQFATWMEPGNRVIKAMVSFDDSI